jgi:DNA-binding YbaB/EbfC family protein
MRLASRRASAQMAQVQEELKEATIEATAGGGAVRVVITGAQEIRSVQIDPSAVDAEEVDLLQDLVMAAVNEAIARSKQLAEERLSAVAGGMGLPGMPGLGGGPTLPPLR